ncbi:MAG: FAD-binding protein [Pseudolabrys sp.]
MPAPLAPRDNLALRRILTTNTSEMMDWLIGLGVVFVGPMPDPPQRVARMHNVVPSSRAFTFHLTRFCKRNGVEIRLSTPCTDLIKDGGRIIGVAVGGRSAASRQLFARQGVILATGDYSGAADLKKAFGAPALADVEPVATTSSGDGYRLGLKAGGSVANGDIMRGPIMRFVPPAQPNWIQKIPPYRAVGNAIAWAMRTAPQWILRPFLMKFLTTVLGPSPALFAEGAVLINKDGDRFADEIDSPAGAVAHQSPKEAYIVFDESLARKFSAWPYFISTAPGIAYAYIDDYRRCRTDIFRTGATPGELARKLGIPPDRLESTLKRYNAGERRSRPAIAEAPYYALGPVRSYVVFTEGGLRINELFQVLAGGRPIDGLYAVGSTGQGGLLLEGHGHHLDWAFISGRLAGTYCAQRPRINKRAV